MRRRIVLIGISGLLAVLMLIISSCSRKPLSTLPVLTSTHSPTKTSSAEVSFTTTPTTLLQLTHTVSAPTTGQPKPVSTTQIAYQTTSTTEIGITPTPTSTVTEEIAQIPQASQTQPIPTETPTITSISGYPGPEVSPTSGGQQQAQGATTTSTADLYPGPQTSTVAPSWTPSKSASATPISATPSRTVSPTPGKTQTGTPQPTSAVTQTTSTPQVTPTELPPRGPLSPPPAGSSVTIWYSWVGAEVEALSGIIQSFKQIYPGVTFTLLYVPFDDLYDTYREAAYSGGGPSLLLGPAKWGASLYDQELITDLYPYVPSSYLEVINPAALVSGDYSKALISLPLSQQGLLMFRNTALLPTPLVTFDDLTVSSINITRGGNVGSYLERGSYFSAPNILGLGGRIMDENNYPVFNDQYGQEWIKLLSDYDVAGAVTLNTNFDLQMFERGRVGLIIDGTWNISTLSQAIGADHLAINPWPTYGTGHLAGWVVSNSVFLNANTNGNDQFAALAFMGYLLDPNVQMRLAEVGHIPSVSTTRPRSPIIQQAMTAFSSSVAYPITVEDNILSIYWKELDAALHNVFEHGADPASALKTASDQIILAIRNLQMNP